MQQSVNIFWFRRDLRLDDNAGLYHALKDDNPVLPVFIFDKHILEQLEDKKDSRVEFILNTVKEMHIHLEKMRSSIEVIFDYPDRAFKKLLKKYRVQKVFTNHDYEPYARDRDEEVKNILEKAGVLFHSYKDQVIFEKDEVVKEDGSPYVVFTPFSKKWRSTLNDFYLSSYPNKKYFRNFINSLPLEIPTLQQLGFEPGDFPVPSKNPADELIKQYDRHRDYPGIEGTSRLGIHLRFGTISVRELARKAMKLNDVFLNELIWREFYQMILWKFPHVGKGRAFRADYDNIEWRYDEKEFENWCNGETGYPLVDAGMRQLNATGFMHNRVRMVTASFLCKHLLIDWRWGEAYFAQKLLDYDLAANNGNWQWAAGSGCDAAPYFRVFNPSLQAKKFDPKAEYIQTWVPEYQDFGYPEPIVEHNFARKRCLAAYSKALKK